MGNANMKNIIDLVPSDAINQSRFVRHFFYGAEKKLKAVRKNIKNINKDTFFDFNQDALIATMAVVVDQKTLSDLYEKLLSISAGAGVEYDGFEVLTEDQTNIEKPFEPFENYFKPWSYIRMPLSNGKFGYLLYIGGDSKNGYFYECIALTDDGKSNINALDAAPRLYRQIVQGYFDPSLFNLVGLSSSKKSMTNAKFRILEGALSPEDLQLIYEKYGFQSPFKDDDWLLLLGAVKKSKGTDFFAPSIYRISVSVGDDGSVNWSDIKKCEDNEEVLPMPFGVIARHENINDALTGGLDLLSLIDETHHCCPVKTRTDSIGC